MAFNVPSKEIQLCEDQERWAIASHDLWIRGLWNHTPVMLQPWRKMQCGLPSAVDYESYRGKLRHPHILQFFGCVVLGNDNIYGVFECFPGCQLGTLLTRLDSDDSPLGDANSLRQNQVLSILSGVATSVLYLHQRNIVVRMGSGLTVNNVYVDERLQSYLIDVDSDHPSNSESHTSSQLDDVHDFGVLIWRILSKNIADYPHDVVEEFNKLSKAGHPQFLVELFLLCSQPDSSKYPNFWQIVQMIQSRKIRVKKKVSASGRILYSTMQRPASAQQDGHESHVLSRSLSLPTGAMPLSSTSSSASLSSTTNQTSTPATKPANTPNTTPPPSNTSNASAPKPATASTVQTNSSPAPKPAATTAPASSSTINQNPASASTNTPPKPATTAASATPATNQTNTAAPKPATTTVTATATPSTAAPSAAPKPTTTATTTALKPATTTATVTATASASATPPTTSTAPKPTTTTTTATTSSTNQSTSNTVAPKPAAITSTTASSESKPSVVTASATPTPAIGVASMGTSQSSISATPSPLESARSSASDPSSIAPKPAQVGQKDASESADPPPPSEPFDAIEYKWYNMKSIVVVSFAVPGQRKEDSIINLKEDRITALLKRIGGGPPLYLDIKLSSTIIPKESTISYSSPKIELRLKKLKQVDWYTLKATS